MTILCCRVCGAFVSTLIREAKHLETLELCNMPSMKWLHMIRSPMDVLPMLRYLALSEVGADGVEQALFHHLPFLQRASLEGSPSLVWAAARSWCATFHPPIRLDRQSPACTHKHCKSCWQRLSDKAGSQI